MNTDTKTEWRLVPVEPTDEMMQAMDESSPEPYWTRCPWKAALNAAPAPQAKPCERCAELEAEAKARKQAQADLETYKGRCTDLEHQNERLEAENARLTEELSEREKIERHFYDLSCSQEATIAQQTKRIKALEDAIERMRTAGGKDEFQKAFDAAKDCIKQCKCEQLAAQKVIDAAGNLIEQKGRHNTEIAYKRLAKAIAAQKEGK